MKTGLFTQIDWLPFLGLLVVIRPGNCYSLSNYDSAIPDTAVRAQAEDSTTTQNSGTTSDPEDDKRCYRSLTSYFHQWDIQLSRYNSYAQNSPRSYSLTEDLYETIQTIGKGVVYTGCDGIPRFRFDSPTAALTTTSYIVTVTKTQYATSTLGLNNESTWNPEPVPPRCTIAANYCESLWESHLSTATDWVEGFTHQESAPGAPNRRICPPRKGCHLRFDREVVLIYWPPTVTPRDICAIDSFTLTRGSSTSTSGSPPRTITTNAITFRGNDLYKVDGGSRVNPSVLHGNFTFVSPSVYLVHHEISGRPGTRTYSSWGTVGGNYPGFLDTAQHDVESVPMTVLRTPGIIELKSDDIRSIRPINRNINGGTEYARLVARGEFQPKPQAHLYWGGITLSEKTEEAVDFDWENLVDPVPASAYYDARSRDCWGKQSHCGTITDDTYRPALAVRNSVWLQLFPKHYYCGRIALDDPPISLHPLSNSDDAPATTTPALALPEPTPATPGEYPVQPLSSPTAAATDNGISSEDTGEGGGPTRTQSGNSRGAGVASTASSVRLAGTISISFALYLTTFVLVLVYS